MKRLLLGFLLAFTSGCTAPVPAGNIGRTWEAGGFSPDYVKPGRVMCFGRCRLYTMETTEKTFKVPMNILCKDKLNFSFDVSVLTSLNLENKTAILAAFEKLTPAEDQHFTLEQLFETYVEPLVNQEARRVVSRYTIEEIIDNRDKIITEVRQAVMGAVNTGLLQVSQVSVGNLDFPDIITNAQLARAQREIEVETARAEGKKKIAEAEATLQLASVEARRKLLEAKSLADANQIVAASITPQYLAYQQIEAIKLVGQGEGDMILVPYRDNINPATGADWNPQNAVLDAQLLRRIKEAEDAASVPAPSGK